MRRSIGRNLSAALANPDALDRLDTASSKARKTASVVERTVKAEKGRQRQRPNIVRVAEGEYSKKVLMAAAAGVLERFGHRMLVAVKTVLLKQRPYPHNKIKPQAEGQSAHDNRNTADLVLLPDTVMVVLRAITAAADTAFTLNLIGNAGNRIERNLREGNSPALPSLSAVEAISSARRHKLRVCLMLAFAAFPRERAPKNEDFLPQIPKEKREGGKQKRIDCRDKDAAAAAAMEAAVAATVSAAPKLVVQPLSRAETAVGLKLLGLRLTLAQWEVLWFSLSCGGTGSCRARFWEDAFSIRAGASFLATETGEEVKGSGGEDTKEGPNRNGGSKLNESSTMLFFRGQHEEQAGLWGGGEEAQQDFSALAARVQVESSSIARRKRQLANIASALRGAVVAVLSTPSPSLRQGQEGGQYDRQPVIALVAASAETPVSISGGGVWMAREMAGKALMDVVNETLERRQQQQNQAASVSSFTERGRSAGSHGGGDDGSAAAALVEAIRRLAEERNVLDRFIGAFAHALRCSPPRSKSRDSQHKAGRSRRLLKGQKRPPAAASLSMSPLLALGDASLNEDDQGTAGLDHQVKVPPDMDFVMTEQELSDLRCLLEIMSKEQLS